MNPLLNTLRSLLILNVRFHHEDADLPSDNTNNFEDADNANNFKDVDNANNFEDTDNANNFKDADNANNFNTDGRLCLASPSDQDVGF